MFPVGLANHGWIKCDPGILLTASVGDALVYRTAPDPEGDRLEVMEAANDLSDAESEA
jgi:hypothetical protein